MAYYNFVLKYPWAETYNLTINWIRRTIKFDEYIYINIFSLRRDTTFLADKDEILCHTHRIRQNKY